MKTTLTRLIFFFSIFLCAQALAFAAPGDLDTSFNSTGRQTSGFGYNSDTARSLAVQADGKIVVAGYCSNGADNDFAVARYNANGTLDASFDFDGKVMTAIGASHDLAYGVAIQADGKIVVAGHSRDSNEDFALARYNADGSLDSSFGASGKVTTAFGTGNDVAYAVAIQPDGKILAAGLAYNGSNYDFAVARYSANGSLDATFGVNGKATTAVGTSADIANAIALQADGKIVVAGYSVIGATYDFALVRYNSDGTLDTSFSGDGKQTTAIGANDDSISSIAIQPDGKIVAAGHAYNNISFYYEIALARYNSNGLPDTTFSGDGKLTTAFGASDSYARSVAIQTDGKIIIGGETFGSNVDFAVARYASNGALDATFDADGKVSIDFGANDTANAVAIDNAGRLLIAGDSSGSFALARLLTASPTAANVVVSGRVLNQKDGGLMNATVYLTNSNGEIRMARTGMFGYYRFSDVPAGETYIAEVSSKTYAFQTRVVTVSEDVSELNFTPVFTVRLPGAR